MNNDPIKDAYSQINAAKANMADLVARLYPPEQPLHWRRSRVWNSQSGTVIRTAQDRLYVENDANGKRYWIHAYNIVS